MSLLRAPRSAPSITTSFSLPSFFPPSPADPCAPPPREHTGPFASLSRKGSRWKLDGEGEEAAEGASSDDEVLEDWTRPTNNKRMASEHNLRRRRQVESENRALRTLLAEQANTLSALHIANFDLSESVDALKMKLRDAENERRMSERERDWLRRECDIINGGETPSRVPYIMRRSSSAGRTPLSAGFVQGREGDENVPPMPTFELKRSKASGTLAERRDVPRLPPLSTMLRPTPAPSALPRTIRALASPSPSSAPRFFVAASMNAPLMPAAIKRDGSRPTPSARRQRSMELLALAGVRGGAENRGAPAPAAATVEHDGQASAGPDGGEDEEGVWVGIERTQVCLSHSPSPTSSKADVDDDVDGLGQEAQEQKRKVERRLSLQPSLMPANVRRREVSGEAQLTLGMTASSVTAPREEETSAGGESGGPVSGQGARGATSVRGRVDGPELVQLLKKLVPPANVRKFHRLVADLDLDHLTPGDYLNAVQSEVLGLSLEDDLRWPWLDELQNSLEDSALCTRAMEGEPLVRLEMLVGPAKVSVYRRLVQDFDRGRFTPDAFVLRVQIDVLGISEAEDARWEWLEMLEPKLLRHYGLDGGPPAERPVKA